MNERDRERLEQAASSARIAINHTRTAGGAWRDDLKTVDAAAKRVEDVGENLSKVSRELRAATPGIDWKPALGMRTHLVHDYINVDLDVLETTITDDLPRLIAAIESLLG